MLPREKYYDEALKILREDGNREDAEELLRGFLEAVEHRQPIAPAILEWLRHGLSEHLSGQDLERALCLRRPRHRPQGKPDRRNRNGKGGYINDVIAVALLHLLARRGLTHEKAWLLLDSRRAMGKRTLERWDTKENNELRNWPSADLKRLIRDEREFAKNRA